MKIKMDSELKGINGLEPIMDQGKVITLKEICIAALLTPTEGDEEKKKYEKWEIYKKIKDAKTELVELTAEDVTTIKRGIGKIHPPLILGQCFELLEQ